jgi:hypothetical protein
MFTNADSFIESSWPTRCWIYKSQEKTSTGYPQKKAYRLNTIDLCAFSLVRLLEEYCAGILNLIEIIIRKIFLVSCHSLSANCESKS